MPPFAKDCQTGFLVLASDGIKKRKYSCLCPDTHAVCLRQGDKNIHHFAHIPCRGPNGTYIPTCRAGGESEQHIMAKHKLKEWQGRYRFALKTCMVCKNKVMEDCSAGTMTIEARSIDKKWRYDVLYTRNDGTKLALEVYHKHATGEEKIESSALAGIPIAEFDADSILSLEPGGVLDNKCDGSWICSQLCRRLKEKRETEARIFAQQLEQNRLLALQREEETRRRIHQEEQARLRVQEEEAYKRRAQLAEKAKCRAQQEEEARQHAHHQKRARVLAQHRQEPEKTYWPAQSIGFACVSTDNAIDPGLFHELGAVSVERVKVSTLDYFFIQTSVMPISSVEAIRDTLQLFQVQPVPIDMNEPEILTPSIGTCYQHYKFFYHIDFNRRQNQLGSKTTYWHWKRQEESVQTSEI